MARHNSRAPHAMSRAACEKAEPLGGNSAMGWMNCSPGGASRSAPKRTGSAGAVIADRRERSQGRTRDRLHNEAKHADPERLVVPAKAYHCVVRVKARDRSADVCSSRSNPRVRGAEIPAHSRELTVHIDEGVWGAGCVSGRTRRAIVTDARVAKKCTCPACFIN